jgi:hypothetical protein
MLENGIIKPKITKKMKTKQLILSATVLLMSVALSLTSCRKDNSKNIDKDTVSAEDNALADKSFEDLGQISNEASGGGLGTFKNGSPSNDGLLSICAIVIPDLINKKITVDFGTNNSNCLCKDGRYRRGKIYISYTGTTYWDSLSTVTITTSPTDSYFVDDNQIIGTKSCLNNGHNAAGHRFWTITINGKIIKANNLGTITWDATRTLEWIAGEKTILWGDDIYGVTGYAKGTSTSGASFDATITSQLIRKIACPKHFVSGTFDFTSGTKPIRHVDFGYSPAPNPIGSCDGWISVTINGNTIYKQLP